MGRAWWLGACAVLALSACKEEEMPAFAPRGNGMIEDVQGNGSGSSSAGTGGDMRGCNRVIADRDFRGLWLPSTTHEVGAGGSVSGGPTSMDKESKGPFFEVTSKVEPRGDDPVAAIRTAWINLDASYTPSRSGAIQYLNYSQRGMRFEGEQSLEVEPAIQQDDVLYRNMSGRLRISRETWIDQSTGRLSASTFKAYDTGKTPNFIDGTTIFFGFWTGNETDGDGFTVTAGIDEWQVEVGRDCSE